MDIGREPSPPVRVDAFMQAPSTLNISRVIPSGSVPGFAWPHPTQRTQARVTSAKPRIAGSVVLSCMLHAGALAIFIFAGTSALEQPDVLEIPVEIIDAMPGAPPDTPAEPEKQVADAAEPPAELSPTVPDQTPPVEPEPRQEMIQEERSEPPPEPEVSQTPTQPPPEQVVEALQTYTPLPPEPAIPKIETPVPALSPSPILKSLRTQAPPVRAAQPKAVEPRREEPPRAIRKQIEERQREPVPATTPTAPVRQAAPVRPAALPAKPEQSASSGASISAWRSSIASRIASNKTYPESARSRSASGTTILAIAIGPSGGLSSASVSSSSGHADLDAASLSAVRRAAPFPTPPPGAPRTLSVPFRYGLR